MTKQMLAGLAAVAAFGAEAALTAKSYIRDGLAVQFDGIENVAYGEPHDATATQWKDLVGPQTFTLPTGDNAWSFTENGLRTVRANGVGLSNNAALNTAVEKAKFTVECAFNKETETPASSVGYKNTICVLYLIRHANYPFGTINKSTYGFSPVGNGHEGSLKASVAGTASVGQHSLSCVQDGTNWAVRVDGTHEATGAVASLGTLPANWHGFKINCAYYTEYGLDGLYHSLRVYTRPLTATEVSVNRAVDQIRFFGADPATTTLPDGWRFAGTGEDLTLESRLTVAAAPAVGGTVKVDDGEAASSIDMWLEKDTKKSVTLTATPAEGYVFLGWTGKDLTSEQLMENPLTVEVGADVVASFREVSGGEPRAYSFTGGANGRWHDGANWRDAAGAGGVPVAGDTVVIPAGKSVLVDESTARYASLEILGTLTASNWETCVWADAITVGNGGTVTCAGPFTGDPATNRVWLKCVDFLLATGGKIDVNKKGFSGGLTTLGAGYGPGSINSAGAGPSYGGFGGRNAHAAYPKDTYGSAERPDLPGSGGKAGYPHDGYGGLQTCPGGGAVRIEASGHVCVNGEILANGKSALWSSSDTNDLFDIPGTGGAIWISCRTFAGTNGVLSANGGGGCDPRWPFWKYPMNAANPTTFIDDRAARNAGGGRIAIAYDAEAQVSADVVDVKISAGAGLHKGPSWGQTYSTMDKYHNSADCGTVWFTDSKLLDATLGKGLTGQIVNISDYTYEGDLVYAEGHVRFATPGATVTVNGSLSMSGGNSRLEIGGCEYKKRTAYLDIYAGTSLNSLTVKGGCDIRDGARLDIRSAAKANESDFEKWGGEVSVTGELRIGAGGYAYAWCDVVKCTAPRFKVGSLAVEEGGLMSAEGRGGAGGHSSGNFTTIGISSIYGYGPRGTGTYLSPTYSHAGVHFVRGGMGTGYRSDWPKANLYDDEYRPSLSGTGAGSGGYGDGGAGGGVIFVEAEGAMTVDGEINVDGVHELLSSDSNGVHHLGGGAGGTIFLSGATFSGGSAAKLSARGGAAMQAKASACAGAGAGGCIAVWTGKPYADTLPKSRTLRQKDDPLAVGGEFLGRCDVAAGERVHAVNSVVDETWTFPDYAQGTPGTVWFCHVNDAPGLMLLLR